MRYLLITAAMILGACVAPSVGRPVPVHSAAHGMPIVLEITGNGYEATCVPFVNIGGKLWIMTVKHTTDTATHVGTMPIIDLFEHPDVDFAIVSIMSDLQVNIPFARKEPMPGDRLLAIGKQANAMRYMDGRQGGVPAAMSCPIMPGASGGAVLNERNELVGVIQSVCARETMVGTIFAYHVSNYTPIFHLQTWILDQIKP